MIVGRAGNESAVSTGLKVAVRWGRTSLGEWAYPCITRDWRNPNRLLLSMVWLRNVAESLSFDLFPHFRCSSNCGFCTWCDWGTWQNPCHLTFSPIFVAHRIVGFAPQLEALGVLGLSGSCQAEQEWENSGKEAWLGFPQRDETSFCPTGSVPVILSEIWSVQLCYLRCICRKDTV